jgi:pyruvate, water dikinase
MKMPLVVSFSKIGKTDIPLVGGKGANLGEMINAGFPVPNGFCITSEAYRYVIAHNELEPKIRQLLDGLKVSDTEKLQAVSAKIMALIEKVDVPGDLVSQIYEHYQSMKSGFKLPLVAVRSSATAEDLPEASFAGQQATFLNVHGEANVVHYARKAWASLFEPRAIFYRATQGFDHFKVALAIPVQKMVQSDVSGIMFTLNPVTNNKSHVVIESIWGLGEKIVQGAYTPDHYEVEKDDFRIRSIVTARQPLKYVRHNDGNREEKVDKNKIDAQKLNEDQIIALAKIGVKLQQHYFFPQDVEWALEGGKIYIVQTRPITTISAVDNKKINLDMSGLKHLKQLLKGDSASPGAACGTVKIVKDMKDLDIVQTGDVLVTEMTTPDFVPAMKKAVAIVTNKGGQTSHAAIVSRELGVPAVVGTFTATQTLKPGMKVTVDGTGGAVYLGYLDKQEIDSKKVKNITHEDIKTATKVYVNLGEPELAASVASRDVDGIGLVRAEFMMAQIGTHPKKLIHDKKQKIFIEKLADGLEKFCKAFGYRPVVYRASDFKTNEYRNLIGGSTFEPVEPNPMMGYRGAYRYVTDERVFELELEAIKEVRNKRNCKNLSLMVPFVRSVDELTKVKRIIAGAGLYRSNSFKLWMMVEIPSNVILLEQFAAVGIDGISIGSNDLTMLTLGVDRDNESVATLYDERNPAAMWMFEMAVKKAHKLGLTVSMCGQAPSEYPDLAAKLVEWGITSMSVSPDAIERTRQIVYEAEKKLARK